MNEESGNEARNHTTAPDVDGSMVERRAAHEGLATGSPARWARASATHPWRVIGSWVAILVVLIGLVATVGGDLRDEFEIPGSDTQRATDLLESEFTEEQGAVLNLVFAAPEGERLDTPEREAAIQEAVGNLRSSQEFKPTEDKAGLESVGNPFSEDTFSDDGRIAYAEAQFNETIEPADRDEVVAVQDAVRDIVEPAGVTVEYNGEAEFPPVEQGTSELLGLLVAIIGLDFVTKLGIGSALGVLTTVLIANSLLRAVLAKLGHKIDRLKVPFLRQIDDSEAARERTLTARWGRFVTRNHKPVFVVLLLAGIVLAATSALVRLGASDQGTQPTEQTARRAYDLLAEGFGAGFNGPIPIVVDVNGDPQAPDRIYERVQGLPGVASVGEPQLNDEETVGIVFVTPGSAPQDERTDELVERLREQVVP